MEKVVAITGVTKGLGFALMSCFIEDGWQVIGCGRSETKINELKKQFGDKHYFAAINISDSEAVKSWIESAIKKVGTPKMIINNAGIINKPNPLWEISDNEFQDVINANLFGTFFVNKYFLPHLIKKGNALIINVSSGWGRSGAQNQSPYCASKFAIEGLTKSLAKELPKNIATVTLDPGGGINTVMLQTCLPDYARHAESPGQWAKKAYQFILGIKQTDNGKALTVI